MLTDFVEVGQLDYLDRYPEMNRLLLNRNVCCNLECICTSHETVRLSKLIYFYSVRLGEPFFLPLGFVEIELSNVRLEFFFYTLPSYSSRMLVKWYF